MLRGRSDGGQITLKTGKKGDAKTGKTVFPIRKFLRNMAVRGVSIFVQMKIARMTVKTIMEAAYDAPNDGTYRLFFVQQEDGNIFCPLLPINKINPNNKGETMSEQQK